MRARLHLAVVIAVGAVAGLLAATASGDSGAVAVHIAGHPKVNEAVRVSFLPSGSLPAGGYYYAVLVLKPYRRYTAAAPPPCAVSSDMQRTAYGYPRAGHAVSLTLTRTASHRRIWCPGGTYLGAVYAVPNPPPCNAAYPCSSEYSEASPCWEISPGHKVCGVVALRVHRYPEGLPVPLEKATRIVARFHVSF
jgi:hypothetical protein